MEQNGTGGMHNSTLTACLIAGWVPKTNGAMAIEDSPEFDRLIAYFIRGGPVYEKVTMCRSPVLGATG